MTQPSPAEECCVCGSPDVTYHNFREQPFCWPCANCQCALNPCVRQTLYGPEKPQPEPAQPRHTPCLLDACTRACTTECREAIDRAWTSLRGELPPAALLVPAEPVPPSDTEELRGGRHLAQPAQTQHTVDPLLNLVDRAEHHGGLTGDEAQKLRDGIGQLYAEIERMKLLVAASSEDGQAIRMVARFAEKANEQQQRAERAEAARDAVRAVADQWAIYGSADLRDAAYTLRMEVLDPQKPQTDVDTKETQ